MSTVQDIVNFAIDKDAVNLRGALDTVMSSKVSDSISQYAADITASVFSATTGMEQAEEESQPEIASDEGTAQNEDV